MRITLGSLIQKNADRDLRDVTTSSVEAYRFYADGINMHERFREEEAVPRPSLADAPQVFLGTRTPSNYEGPYLTAILIVRLIAFGFFMSIIIKRFNRR